MQVEIIPVSVIIPTRNRAVVLRRTLESLAAQSSQPAQVILVDGSKEEPTYQLCVEEVISGLVSEVVWQPARTIGAGSQRNEGFQTCREGVIGFFDDDIVFEAGCVARLWRALQSDPSLGGVSAMITNQHYHQPGFVSYIMFRLMSGRAETSYAGRVLGPAVNLLPDDSDDLPEIVPVEWLNLTCTFYRRQALPRPLFADHFTGYSIMEDLTLSLMVGKHWNLANARTARIFHDSQPGAHKSDPADLAKMELENRYYVMTQVLSRSRWIDFLRLAVWEMFQLLVEITNQDSRTKLPLVLRGKLNALRRLLTKAGQDYD